MQPVKVLLKNLGGKISKNSPQILTGLGCAGVVSTAVLAVRGTPKALGLLEDYYDEHGEMPNAVDTVKTTWKCYIPAAVVGTASISCIIGANCISSKRNAALAALYSLSEATFREYQTKVVETIGQNKERKVRDDINQERVQKNPPGSNEVIFTGNGEVMCLDKLSGRYFKSSYEAIRQIVNDMNFQLRNDNWMSLNDLYYELGLSNIDLGDMMGFDIDKGQIDPNYSSTLDANGQPCLVVDFKVYPMYDR